MNIVQSLPSVCLVLGGSRSGKSRYAEALINSRGHGLYLATAEKLDVEMGERIKRHKARRGSNWELIEEPIDIGRIIANESKLGRPILVDCLTLWVSNMMHAKYDCIDALPAIIASAQATAESVVFVSNEVGLGIVPDNLLAREFRDVAGMVNQSVAQAANTVVFVAAGLPMFLKGEIS